MNKKEKLEMIKYIKKAIGGRRLGDVYNYIDKQQKLERKRYCELGELQEIVMNIFDIWKYKNRTIAEQPMETIIFIYKLIQ